MSDRVKLNADQRKMAKQLYENGNDFFRDWHDLIDVSPKQFAVFEKAQWILDAPKVEGKPVRNKIKRVSGVLCAHRDEDGYCQAIATRAVGQYGYCDEHFAEATDKLNAYKATVTRKSSPASEDLYDEGFERL